MKEKNKYCGCLYYSANALSRIITKMGEEAFSETGLAPSYAFLLMIVNEDPGIQPMDIADKMQLQPSTVTRLIDKMVEKNYLSRRSEGRSTFVEPTEKSKELDEKLKIAWFGLYKKYSAILGDDFSQKLTNDIYDAYIKLNN